MAVHDGSSDFTCWVCHEEFMNEASLGQHLSNSHPQNSPFHCAACDEDFISELFLQIHMSDYHSKNATNEDDKSNSPKAAGNSKVAAGSSSRSNIDFVSVKKEHQDKDDCFWCPVCFKGFSKKEDLRLHFHSDHVVSSGSLFVCELCGTGKPTAEMLCWHLEVHSISPYSVNKFSKLRLLLRKDVSMDTDTKKSSSINLKVEKENNCTNITKLQSCEIHISNVSLEVNDFSKQIPSSSCTSKKSNKTGPKNGESFIPMNEVKSKQRSTCNVSLSSKKEDHVFNAQAFDKLLSDREGDSVSVMTGTKTPGQNIASQIGNLNSSLQVVKKSPSRKEREEGKVSIPESNLLNKSKILEEEKIPLLKKSLICEGKQPEKVSLKSKNDFISGITKSSTKKHKHGSEANLEKLNELQTRSSINKIINNDHAGKSTDQIADKSNDNVNLTLNDSCPLTLEELLSQHVEGITQIIPRQTNLIRNNEKTEMDSVVCNNIPNENKLDKIESGVTGEVLIQDDEPTNFEDSNRKKLDDKEVSSKKRSTEKVNSTNCKETITRQCKSTLKKKSKERTKGWLQRKHNRKLIINSKLINKKGKETEHKDIQIDTSESNEQQIENLRKVNEVDHFVELPILNVDESVKDKHKTNEQQIENLRKVKEVDHFVELPMLNVDESVKDKHNLNDFQKTSAQEIKNLEESCSPTLEAKTKDALCSQRDEIYCDVTSKVLDVLIEDANSSPENITVVSLKEEKTIEVIPNKNVELNDTVEITLTQNITDADKNAEQKRAVNKTGEDSFSNQTLSSTKKENGKIGDENAENIISVQPDQSSGKTLNKMVACTMVKNLNLPVMNTEEKDVLNKIMKKNGSLENEQVTAEEVGEGTYIKSCDCLDTRREEKICDAVKKINIDTYDKLDEAVKVKQAESFYKLVDPTAECSKEDVPNKTVKLAEESQQEEDLNTAVKDIGIKLDLPIESAQEKGEDDINESEVKRKHNRLKTVEEGNIDDEGFMNQDKPAMVTEQVGLNSAIEQSKDCEGLMKYFDFDDDDDEKFVKTGSNRSLDSVQYQNLDLSFESSLDRSEKNRKRVSEKMTLRNIREEMNKEAEKGEPTNQKSSSSQNMCDLNDQEEVKDSNRTSDSSEEFSCSMCTLVFCDQDEFLDHVGTHLE